MSLVATFQEELKLAEKALAVAEAELAANVHDAAFGGVSVWRAKFMKLRNEQLKEQIEKLKPQITALRERIEYERRV